MKSANLIFYFINVYVWTVSAEIHVNTIELRPPKWHDIGLIFGDIPFLQDSDP